MVSLEKAARLVHHAEAMNRQGTLTPASPPEVAAEWLLLGYVSGQDATLLQRVLGQGERVYFGFIARNNVEPDQYVMVIRGTEPLSFVEWLEDGFAALIPGPDNQGMVHAGMYKLAQTLEFDLSTVPADAALTLIGHSLGSALVAYTHFELAGERNVNSIMFASPKPGDKTFCDRADYIIGKANYQLINYSRDIVPHLPLSLPGLRFTSLPQVEWITPGTAQVQIRNEVRCAHHALSYAAMLSGEYDPADSCVIHPTTKETPP